MPRAGRRRRLSRSSEFERVYRHGRSKANRFLVLYAFPRDGVSRGGDAQSEGTRAPARSFAGDGESGAAAAFGDAELPRLGLSVSRKVGGAVERARVKRTLREAFDAFAGSLPEGSDYVIVARPPARELAEREGTAGMERELAELIAALGGAPAVAARSAESEVTGSVDSAASAQPATDSLVRARGDVDVSTAPEFRAGQ